MRTTRKHTIFAILFFAFSIQAVSQQVQVPLHHWSYHFIDRCEAKGLLQHALTGTRPWTRTDMGRVLIAILDNSFAKLSKVERHQLNDLLVEFADALPAKRNIRETRLQRIRQHPTVTKWLPGIVYPQGRHFLRWQDEQILFCADPVLGYSRVQEQAGKTVERVTNGLRMFGEWQSWLSFFADARDNSESGGGPYSYGNYTLPRRGFVRSTSPNVLSYDETESAITIAGNGIRLTYGKFKNQWGPARFGNLILSDYATSYDQLKFEVVHPRFVFTSIYAYLIDYKYNTSDELQPKKYFAGHRLEVLPGWRLTLGLSETVIFKDRSFEPAYLNPVMFLRSAEHYHGSPDNALMAFDIAWRPVNNMKLYSELLIDDITTSKLGTDYYGNKWGWIGGIFFVAPLTRYNFDVRLEYGRIRPYTYTHYQTSHNYTHYDSPLGYWIGPNADRMSVELNILLSRYLQIKMFADVQRHGENVNARNVGGDINYGFHEDVFYIKFLDGHINRQKDAGCNVRYELFRQCFFDFYIMHEYESNDNRIQVAFSLNL